MDSYSYSNSASSSSSSYNSYNSSNSSTPFQQQEKNVKQQPAFRSSLHSVRRPPSKNVITKKPIAPLPPTPPKIYKVEPIDFMDVVQKLTGAPEFIPTRLQDVAPPPLSLSPPQHRFPILHPTMKTPQEERPTSRTSFDSTFGALSPLGFSLSPSSLAWCSSILLSPGTLSSLEPSAVL